MALAVADPFRPRSFYADVLGLPFRAMDDVPRGEFAFDAGGALAFTLASREPASGDHFDDVRIGPGRRAFASERAAALHAPVDRLRVAHDETNGVEVFAPTGDRSVAFRDLDNIQLEDWLDEEP